MQVLVRTPAWCRNLKVKPEAKLTTLHIPLRPSESALAPLTDLRCVCVGGLAARMIRLRHDASHVTICDV